MIKGIFVVAGHGESATGMDDNGASAGGTNERKEVVEVAQELVGRLRSDPAFSRVDVVQVGITERMSLKEKIAYVEDMRKKKQWAAKECLLVSIHFNYVSSPSARGVEAWVATKDSTTELANAVVASLCKATGFPKRNPPVQRSSKNRHGRLGILDDTRAQSVLIECGFLSNPEDAGLITDDVRDDEIALGIHAGIRSFLGIREKPAFFTDVLEGSWFRGHVERLLAEGFLEVPDDGRFRPADPLTRAEAAKLFSLFLDHVAKQ